MILNTPAVLLAALGLLRLALGSAALVLGWAAARDFARAATPDGRDTARARLSLVFLLALVLVALSFLSWPLLYLLLQSYVREWPGVMCIYGVTRIGTGSDGPARFLPDLVRGLQFTGPGVALAGGSWFVLYRLNRAAPSDPLLGRLFLALGPLSALAACDAAGQVAYVCLPKAECFPSAGCCGVLDESAGARFVPRAVLGRAGDVSLSAAYFALQGSVIAALVVIPRTRWAASPGVLAALSLAGAVSLAVGGGYLVESVAPALLHLPGHHCAYDLVAAPQGVVAVVLFVAGTCCVWWAGVAAWVGRTAETAPLVPGVVRDLLRLARVAYTASLVVLVVSLVLS